MASQFIGLHMRVVLRNPAGYELMGTVQDVQAGSGLTLTNVFIPATQQRTPHMRLDASNIADLSEIPKSQPTSQPAFVDPAILSLGRRPTSDGPPTPTAQHQPAKRLDRDIADSVNEIKIDAAVHSDQNNSKPIEPREPKSQKKKGRSRQSKNVQGHVDDGTLQVDGSPVQGAHGKGWRQTPILQSTSSFQPFNSLKRSGKGQKSLLDNGWASEDVTEEMGDFDFENNLAKFDKRTIFDQMRKEDQVDEGDRLVSHNRRVKPGTAGGKNLHYTENVLELPSNTGQSADFWNSEADVGVNEAEKLGSRDAKNGQPMKRTESKSGVARRSQSRKASTAIGGQPLSRVNSSQTQQQTHQPGLYLLPSMRRVEAISTLQMLNLENIAANEIGFSEGLMAENAGRGIAEVAVKALSDPAIKVRFELAGASSSIDSSANGSSIVILAGNNKSSIRALAAGRHLRNKNMEVVVCLAGIEREKDLLEDLRRQIQLYRNFGGKVLSKNDFFEHLRKSAATGSQVSVSLIIDSLLGLTISFEELRIGDQATVYELMEWANRNEAFVLSVDVPTGIDPTSGKIAIIDGGQLFVKPRYVVAIGAPKRGLLEAVTPAPEGAPEPFNNAAHEDQWRLFIADLGLGGAVWRKAGTKIRRGIDFDGKWVVEMKYRGAEVDSDDE